jgi:hypothetical protein
VTKPGNRRHQNRKGRATAQPSQKTETIAIDVLTESLIETFPASDPPAWVALARVGAPRRRMTSRSQLKKS